MHYHIFKNAVTSLDAALRESFAETWEAFDGEAEWNNIQAGELLAFIESRPALRV